MKVKVKYFTTLREIAQCACEELEMKEGATLADLIETIALKYGREARRYLYSDENEGEVDPSIYFLVNGKNSKMLNGFKTSLKDGDVVAIIPPKVVEHSKTYYPCVSRVLSINSTGFLAISLILAGKITLYLSFFRDM